MTKPPLLTRAALAMTLTDGVAVCDQFGRGSRLQLHRETTPPAPADIIAPAAPSLTPDAAKTILGQQPGLAFLSFGNQAAPPDLDGLAPVLEMMIAAGGGFMAASFANPGFGRSVFQGHLFQHGRLVANLIHAMSERLSGRVALIAHDTVTAGPAGLRARVTACREQGVALALIDTVDAAPLAAIREALSTQPLIGGPSWLLPLAEEAAPAAPPAPQKTVVLSGALDRQSLFQLGAAQRSVPLLQLAPTSSDALATALAWAAAQEQNFIISTSAPPDRLSPNASGAGLLADIAAGLAASGCRRFVLGGNDTASAILAQLGITMLHAGAPAAGLRWLDTAGYSFLPKPGGFGGRDLLLDGFEPQIRLNEAAE